MNFELIRTFHDDEVICPYSDGYIISKPFYLALTDEDFRPIREITLFCGNSDLILSPDQRRLLVVDGDCSFRLISLPDLSVIKTMSTRQEPFMIISDIHFSDEKTIVMFSREMERQNNDASFNEFFEHTDRPRCIYYSADDLSYIQEKEIREDCQRCTCAINSTQEFIYTDDTIYAHLADGDKDLEIRPLLRENIVMQNDRYYIPKEDGLAIFDLDLNHIDNIRLNDNYMSIEEKEFYRNMKSALATRAPARSRFPSDQLAFHLCSYDLDDEYAYMLFRHSFQPTCKLCVVSLVSLEEVFSASFSYKSSQIFIHDGHLFLRGDDILEFAIER